MDVAHALMSSYVLYVYGVDYAWILVAQLASTTHIWIYFESFSY